MKNLIGQLGSDAVLLMPEWGEVLKRSSLLRVLLVIAVGLVTLNVYHVWQFLLMPLPELSEEMPSLGTPEPKQGAVNPRITNTSSIVERNLFDPERGTSNTKQTKPFSQSRQTIEGFVLLGTVIDGGKRYAVLRIPSTPVPGAARRNRRGAAKGGRTIALQRVTLGDTVRGFKLTEVHAQKVVFRKGSETFELMLDFLTQGREVERRAGAGERKGK